jgi:hypothetical protein
MRDACICLQAKENHLGTFVTKPPPPKPFKDKISAINICPKLSHFDQKAKL